MYQEMNSIYETQDTYNTNELLDKTTPKIPSQFDVLHAPVASPPPRPLLANSTFGKIKYL